MASSDEILCAGEDECLHPSTAGKPQSQNRRSNSERNSPIVVAGAAVAAAAAVVAAVPVLNVGQSVVSRGRCREQFRESRMPVAAKSPV